MESISNCMKIAALTAVFALVLLAGCTDSPRSQEQVRRETAAATSTLKSDLKGAAEGIRDGLKSDPAKKAVDVNSASRAEFEALPGFTPALANAVIAHRPYASPDELRKRQIVPKDVYKQNSSRLVAK